MTAPDASRARNWRTLAQCLEQKEDNFLLLRYLAAALVIFGHSYPLSGIPGARDFIAQTGWAPHLYTSAIAVDMFFVISGFLVTGSWLRRQKLGDFSKSRLLRLMPALILCLLLSACVLGPIYTTLPLSDYWTDPATRGYVSGNLSFTRLVTRLPGVFEDNPAYPGVVNGSLWTLPAELRMYIFVGVFGAIGLLKRRWLATLVIAALIALGIAAPKFVPFVHHDTDRMWIAGMFAFGALAYLQREWIRLSGWILLGMIGVCALLHATSAFMLAYGITLAYACLWFAYCLNFHFFNRVGDYSYGVYLYGFPVQQAVVHHLSDPQPMTIFAWSLPIATLLAMFSWHALEEPALRLKRVNLQQWWRNRRALRSQI